MMKRSNPRNRHGFCVCAISCIPRGVAMWWTCAELNCGLTRFTRGHYTLSLWSISPKGSPQTNCRGACFRNSFRAGGNQPAGNVPYCIDALIRTVGNAGRTELNAVKPQVLRGGKPDEQRSIFCFYYQHLNEIRFYGAEPPACVLRNPLAIESETGPYCKSVAYLLLYVFFKLCQPFLCREFLPFENESFLLRIITYSLDLLKTVCYTDFTSFL